MKGPRNMLAKQNGERPERPPLMVRDWYRTGRRDEAARRQEVWGLLEWYHHTVVAPQRGLRGWLRRVLNRIRGRSFQDLSPWQQINARMEAALEQAAREAAEEVEESVGGEEGRP